MSVPPSPPDPELVLEHAPYVRALARQLVFDRQLARDLEQDVLLAALENAPRDPGSLKGWLAAVVRNLASKAFRSGARRRERESRAARSDAAVPTPAEILAREDLRRWLLEHLLALEEPVRSVMILRFAEELPPREVARRLKVPVETVRTRTKRGLEELRARLDRDPRRGNGVWCLALVRGLQIAPPSVLGAGLKLAGLGLAGVLAVSTLKKILVAAVVVALATTAVILTRQLEPLHPPAEAQAPLPGPDTTKLSGSELAGAASGAEQRSAIAAEEKPAAPAAVSTSASLQLKLSWHDGQPAAGVTARMYDNGAADFYADVFDVKTGDDGTYLVESLPPGHVSAYLDRGPVGECKLAAGERGTIELTIPRGFDLAGEVVERDGRPVADAEILSDQMGNGWNAFPVARTGADGRFRIRSLRPGICWLSARAALRPPSPQHEFIGGEVDIENVRIVLDPQGAAVAGTVFDPRGEPLAHAQVLVGNEQSYDQLTLENGQTARVPAAQFVSTDAAGRFEVRGAPLGKLAVQARGPGCAPWKGEVETASGVATQLVIRMQAGARLTGRAADPEGKPIARAEVQVGAYGFASRYARADSEGRFALQNLPLGEFEVVAQVDGREPTKSKLFGSAGAELVWNPVLGKGLAIRGRLVAQGIDFSGWWMYCESEDWQKAPYAQSATPKADGSFEFAGCGDAQHKIRVHAPGAGLYPVVTIAAKPSSEPLLVPIDTAMLPSCRVRGRILGESGKPLAGVQFNPVLGTANVSPIETTDAAGRFDLGPLPPGEYLILVHTPGYATFRSEKATLAAEAQWDFGDLQLQQGGTILVHLAAPAAGRCALEVRRGESGGVWVGLENGQARSEALEPGEYELRAWVDGAQKELAGAPVHASVRAGEETLLELKWR